MIHWGWVVAAFVTGTWFGIIIEGLFAAKGAQDRCDGCLSRMRVDMETRVNMRDAEIGRRVREVSLRALHDLAVEAADDPNLSDLGAEHRLDIQRDRPISDYWHRTCKTVLVYDNQLCGMG
jgi:hypothetical protein